MREGANMFELRNAEIREIVPATIEGGVTQVIGTFTFNGRTKKGQTGDFRYSFGPGMKELKHTPALDFTINYLGRYGWHKRKMKDSGQKMSLTHDLTKQVKAMVGAMEALDQMPEYGVDKERELAGEQTLDNAALAAAAAKDTADKLEIPSFLKRS